MVLGAAMNIRVLKELLWLSRRAPSPPAERWKPLILCSCSLCVGFMIYCMYRAIHISKLVFHLVPPDIQKPPIILQHNKILKTQTALPL